MINTSPYEAALGANLMVRPIINTLDADETDGEVHTILSELSKKIKSNNNIKGVNREQIDTEVNAVAMNDEQRGNMRRINELTDRLVTEIEANPEAHAANERIRERTIGALRRMANLHGRQATTRDDIERLIANGVDFVVGQLRNQYRQDDFFAKLREKLTNLLLTIRFIYDRIMKENDTLTDPEQQLTPGQLIIKLLNSLRDQLIKFLTETNFYQAVQQYMAKQSTASLYFYTALSGVLAAIVIYRYRDYFKK